jgi:hypothetical protein
MITDRGYRFGTRVKGIFPIPSSGGRYFEGDPPDPADRNPPFSIPKYNFLSEMQYFNESNFLIVGGVWVPAGDHDRQWRLTRRARKLVKMRFCESSASTQLVRDSWVSIMLIFHFRARGSSMRLPAMSRCRSHDDWAPVFAIRRHGSKASPPLVDEHCGHLEMPRHDEVIAPRRLQFGRTIQASPPAADHTELHQRETLFCKISHLRSAQAADLSGGPQMDDRPLLISITDCFAEQRRPSIWIPGVGQWIFADGSIVSMKELLEPSADAISAFRLVDGGRLIGGTKDSGQHCSSSK